MTLYCAVYGCMQESTGKLHGLCELHGNEFETQDVTLTAWLESKQHCTDLNIARQKIKQIRAVYQWDPVKIYEYTGLTLEQFSRLDKIGE